MARKETLVQRIVRLASKQFPSFGGGKWSTGNPISYALKDKPPAFATGVDIEQVVRFILAKRSAIECVRLKKSYPGNDARDISYTSGLMKPLSNKALETIQNRKQREIRQQLRRGNGLFSQLSKETREKLLHLPISWVREGAHHQMEVRKSDKLRSGRKT